MRILILFLSLFFAISLAAQPTNDDCGNALTLSNLEDWCSPRAAFTTVDATSPNTTPVGCLSTINADVWFRFTAIATDLTVTISGNTSGQSGGSLNDPELAFYVGSCASQIMRKCATSVGNGNFTELNHGGLIPGATYWIQVKGEGAKEGTFQLCINNFNPPVAPGGDCISTSVLCDKNTFNIPAISGAGNDPDEASGTCLGTGGLSESSSTWFSWTAKTTGDLSFTIKPNKVDDDIDFALFELPEGIKNCNSKRSLRCMAAGDFIFPSPCMGPTGLRDGEGDTVEAPGCEGNNNSFLSPLGMTEGKSYALLINNYSNSGGGFSISFSGSGEFLGPEPDFDADFSASQDEACAMDVITITDRSTDPNNEIEEVKFGFGLDAVPAEATGAGPHQVSYLTPGEKSIVVLVKNKEGCQVTKIKKINIAPCCETKFPLNVAEILTATSCGDTSDGAISLNITSNYPPSNILWENGSTAAVRNGLAQGDYQVTVTDEYCETIKTITVPGPEPFVFDTIMTLATCAGGQDGALELGVTGGIAPYAFNWNDGNGFTSNNKIENLSIGVYPLRFRDANGCEVDMDLEVRELELILDPTVVAVTNPTCFGFSDGSVQLVIDNGAPPFLYDWNDGLGFVTRTSLENISSGTFVIDVIDANQCSGQFNLEVAPPPPLAIELDSIAASCFGDEDGVATVDVQGGIGAYVYQWDDPRAQTTATATGLPAGNYGVTVLDSNLCEINGTLSIGQPAELFITSIDVIDVLCFSEGTGVLDVLAGGGNPPYEYSLNEEDYQISNILDGLIAGDYTVFVRDQLGCTVSQNATIVQPSELIIELGENQTIDLGQSIELENAISPSGRVVDYMWRQDTTLSCTDCAVPTAMPVDQITYAVTITDETGCTAEDSIRIRVQKIRPIHIPNAFSPNGDGNNDMFGVFGGTALQSIHALKVFNRWGALVFEANDIPKNDPSFGWDGTFRGEQLSDDVYVYVVEALYIDGEIITFGGDLTLLR